MTTAAWIVHYSSGVYNKAFYNCWPPRPAGTRRRPSRCSPAPTADYWTANISFNNGACGVQTAATDLGYTVADVTAAFSTPWA
jgi:vibriolysin